jgi:hypothetical protein
VRNAILCSWLLVAAVLPVPSSAMEETISLGIRGHLVRQELFSLFASPGESLSLTLPGHASSELRLYLDGQQYGRAEPGHWSFNAPDQPGLYRLTLQHGNNELPVRLNLFVGVPADEIEGDSLNGYRLGPPPPGHETYRSLYRAPASFIEVTEENIDTRLTPHFTLGQFLCKQEGTFPKYVALNESLLLLLENLLQAVREAGYPVDTFGVISGYRTPDYNRRIGNVPNSRHVYGDAMDLFVDADGDGRMDDLNGDGRLNRADVDRLYEIVEKVKSMPDNAQLVGGVGRYYQASHHGGFVHVDARGYRARW